MKGVKCVSGMLEQVDGEGLSFTEVLPMLSFFQTREVKQTTSFRGPLEIGDWVKINLFGFIKVSLIHILALFTGVQADVFLILISDVLLKTKNEFFDECVSNI